MITHRNIETMFANFYAHFRYHDDTRHLVVAPMTHTAGIVGALHFARGGTNVIMSKVTPQAIVDAIEKHRITHLFLPPTVLYMTLALPDIRKRDFSSLQHFLVGAAPTSLEKLKEAIDGVRAGDDRSVRPVRSAGGDHRQGALGLPRRQRQHHRSRACKASAAPCVFNQVAILDDDGKEVAAGAARRDLRARRAGDAGLLQEPGSHRRGAPVRLASHRATSALMDRDGFITIVDRKKDMIITGGFNVYPNELEQVLMTHPAVQDCAVIGVPDDKWGEAIKAVVQLKPGKSAERRGADRAGQGRSSAASRRPRASTSWRACRAVRSARC